MGPSTPDEMRRRIWWLGVVPLGLTGGLVGALLIAPLRRGWAEFSHDCLCEVMVPAWEHVMYGCITAGMTMAALNLALSAESISRRTTVLCLAFGWLNSPACLFAWSVTHASEVSDGFRTILWSPVLGLFLGAFVALPFGGIYGVMLAPVMARLGALRRRPTIDTPARALRGVALTLAAGMLIAGGLATTLDAPVVPPAVFFIGTLLSIAAFIGAAISASPNQALARPGGRGCGAGLDAPRTSRIRGPRAPLHPSRRRCAAECAPGSGPGELGDLSRARSPGVVGDLARE